jgi:CspA family cold shock protein
VPDCCTGKAGRYYLTLLPHINLSLTQLITNNNTMSDKNQGTVKFFNSEKGFGFIKHDDSSKETFVHASGLIDQVNEGDKVEFDLQEGKKGMNAVNVKKVG